MIARLLAATILAATLANPLACAPTPDGQAGNPAGNRTENVTFVIETFAANDRRPTARLVQMTVTAIQVDGKIAPYIHKETGETRPGPYVANVKTPWRHNTTLTPGIASVSVKVVYLGLAGELLSCRVDKDGMEIGGTRQAREIVAGPRGRGAAEVICLY